VGWGLCFFGQGPRCTTSTQPRGSPLASSVSSRIDLGVCVGCLSPATSLGPLGVDSDTNPSEWAIVGQGGKRVPLPDFFPSPSLSVLEELRKRGAGAGGE
jgi:hypothetical protein